MMTPSQISAIVRAGESESVEFKSGNASLDDVAKAVCGFLNSQGGSLFIGLELAESKRMNYPGSQEEARQLLHKIQEAISPRAILSGSVEEIDGGRLLVIESPAGSEGPYVFKGDIYVRVGSQTHVADSGQVSHVIQTRLQRRSSWEKQSASDFSLDDLDLGEVDETVREARNRDRWNFTNPRDTQSVLEDLGLMNRGQLTQAAVVLFGGRPSRLLTQLRSRATRFASDKTGDELLVDREFGGNLFSQFSKLADFCESQIELSSEFVPGKWQRNDRPQFPLEAVREGLLNALIHQDFSNQSGGVTVGLYPGRLEIWNYGELPPDLSPNDLRKTHASLPRNPLIARVFFIRGLIERIGRGTAKIHERCDAFKMPHPTWRKHSGGTLLTLRVGVEAGQIELAPKVRPLSG
ncbi:RNA-binding domain-containing protein [Haloferula sargassicola]|uniref:Schlafen AlbA-2 domain-containing protein n=1 Tax=Haloferula sargassicola TaxID=490096 RepID=A0ABP9UXS0_9BACT